LKRCRCVILYKKTKGKGKGIRYIIDRYRRLPYLK